MSRKDAEQVEIAVEVKRETSRALLVFDGKKEVWIPKSQITDQTGSGGNTETITIPEWLAMNEGLI